MKGPMSPVVIGQTAQETNVSAYERSDQQAHSGDYGWKITVELRQRLGCRGRCLPKLRPAVQRPHALDSAQGSARGSMSTPVRLTTWSDGQGLMSVPRLGTVGTRTPKAYLTLQAQRIGESVRVQIRGSTLKQMVTPTASCEVVRLALRISDRSAAHVVYWDDVSFRSES